MGDHLPTVDIPAPPFHNPPPWRPRQPMLLTQLTWIVRLRWLAGAGVVVGGLLEQLWLDWYHPHGLWIAAVGLLILAYNALFWRLLRGAPPKRQTVWSPSQLHALAWAQILVDLACLTTLTLLTGGLASPFQGFFVFHMVFASLLFPRVMAFAAALVAITMVTGTLAAFGQRARSLPQLALQAAWVVTLLVTVYLAGRLAQNLRAQARRLGRQNRKIRAMSAQLRQQQQALAQQEKMVAMGQMAAGVAHEVANPLASMDGLLQLLERRPEKITPGNLARLREQVARVNQIVRQLTTFAHPGEALWQNANLNDVVTHALEVLRFDPRLKQLQLEESLDPRVPMMRLQPAALEQVFLNIVINALDAMQGRAAAKLGVRTLVQGNDVTLQISDTGCGIPAELRARIFEPFFTTKPVGKGTGLGLSISYSIIRKHGGDIAVESAPGTGSVFTIRLPLAPQSREGGAIHFVTPEKIAAK